MHTQVSYAHDQRNLVPSATRSRSSVRARMVLETRLLATFIRFDDVGVKADLCFVESWFIVCLCIFLSGYLYFTSDDEGSALQKENEVLKATWVPWHWKVCWTLCNASRLKCINIWMECVEIRDFVIEQRWPGEYSGDMTSKMPSGQWTGWKKWSWSLLGVKELKCTGMLLSAW